MAAQSYKPTNIECKGVNWSLSGDEVTIRASRIEDKSDWDAGALNMTLWFSERQYGKGLSDEAMFEMADGVVEGGVSLETYGGLYVAAFKDTAVTGKIKADPPTGDYYPLIVVYELQADGDWSWRTECAWSEPFHWDNRAEIRQREAERERALNHRETTVYELPPADVRQRIFDAIAEAKAHKNARRTRPETQAYMERLDALPDEIQHSASVCPWTEIGSGFSGDSSGCVLPEFVAVGRFLREETTGKAPFPAEADGHFPSGAFHCLLPFREASGICFEGEPEKVGRQVQLCVLRILLSLHPKSVKLTLVDTKAMGGTMKILLPLKSSVSDFKMVCTAEDIESFLERIQEEVMEKNTSTLSKHEWLWQYNEENPAAAEPYRIVVFSSGREGVGTKSAQLLEKLAMRENAARAGIYFLICDAADGGRISSPVIADAGNAVQIDAAWQRCRQGMGHVVFGSGKVEAYKDGWIDTRDDGTFSEFRLECPSPSPDVIRIAQQRIVANGKSQAKDVVRTPVPADKWWTRNSADGLLVPVGMQSGAEVQYVSLGNGGIVHNAIVGGSVGTGKTILLHDLILNAARLYSPAELRMHLLDYKEGTEFACYKTLPHLDNLSIGPNVEFGLDVLNDLSDEIARRAKSFKSVGVSNLREFRNKTGKEMPRHLVIIDEFQVLWTDPVCGEQASAKMEDLVRRGRSFGLNFILSTQSLRGANLSAAAKESLGLRICLRLSESDCEDFLSPGNMVAAGFTKAGEAVYNERGGLPDGNKLFRSAYLGGSEIVSIIRQLHDKAAETKQPIVTPNVYEGDDFVPVSDLSKAAGPRVLCIGRTKGLRPTTAGLPVDGEGFRALAVVGGSKNKRETVFTVLVQQLSETGVPWRQLQDGSLKEETDRWRRWDMGMEPVGECPAAYVIRNLDQLKDARDFDVQSALRGVIDKAPDWASPLLLIEASRFDGLVTALNGTDKSSLTGILALDEDAVFEVSSKNASLGMTEGWWVGPSMEEGRKVVLATRDL